MIDISSGAGYSHWLHGKYTFLIVIAVAFYPINDVASRDMIRIKQGAIRTITRLGFDGTDHDIKLELDH